MNSLCLWCCVSYSWFDVCPLTRKSTFAQEANAVAKKLYSALWTAICDAKTRRRRPNGSIISQEEEEEEIRKAEEDMKAKQAVWAEREKGLQSEKLSYMPFAK